ncbi:MAG: carboxypeptidase-like regulatory domain-containing protein [Solirubrobacteraceae bacterium]
MNAALTPGGQIAGTVTAAPSGAALAGVEVSAYDAAGDPIASARTGDDGAYGIDGLAAGSYRVVFDATGAGDEIAQFAGGAATLAAASAIDVAIGQTMTGIDAALATGGQITGTVTDDARPMRPCRTSRSRSPTLTGPSSTS